MGTKKGGPPPKLTFNTALELRANVTEEKEMRGKDVEKAFSTEKLCKYSKKKNPINSKVSSYK